MSTFQALISQRRSVRHYTPTPLHEDQIVAIVEAGLRAPSYQSLQPWQLVVVDSPYLLHQLAECKPTEASFVEKAAVAIVLAADPQISDTWIEDCSIAHTYMWLQAVDLGLSGCWVQLRLCTQTDGTPSADFVRDILNLPPHLHPHSLLCIGHAQPAQHTPLAQEALAWEKIHFNGLPREDTFETL